MSSTRSNQESGENSKDTQNTSSTNHWTADELLVAQALGDLRNQPGPAQAQPPASTSQTTQTEPSIQAEPSTQTETLMPMEIDAPTEAGAQNHQVTPSHSQSSRKRRCSSVSSSDSNKARHKRARHESSSPLSPDTRSSASLEWNDIIPVASRAVTVGNTAHHTNPRVMDTPTRTNPRPPQQEERMWGLRVLLGEPVGFTESDLCEALARPENGWDLGTALRALNSTLNRARHRHATNAPRRNGMERMRDRLFGADSLHHNRRLGLDYLYETLVAWGVATTAQPLTTLTLGNALIDHDFDYHEAAIAIRDRFAGLTSETRAEHEQQRVVERRQRLLTQSPMHRDRRVARFMGIAGTDDYYAALRLLQQHNYDLHRAMDHWMQYGLAAATIPREAMTRANFAAPRLDHLDHENLWPAPRQLAGPIVDTEVTDEDMADVAATYGDPAYRLAQAHFVRFARHQAYSGIDIPTRRRAAYVQKGRYAVLKYDLVPVKGQKGKKAAFDHNNVDHVKKWNSQSSQWYRRYTGEILKSKPPTSAEEDKAWIYDWHTERLKELLSSRNVPRVVNGRDWGLAEDQWPMKIDMNRLHREYNEYATQNDRPTRSRGGLESARRRIPALCEDFGIPYAPPHGAKKQKKPEGKKPEASQQEDSQPEDSDAEEEPTLDQEED